MRVLLDTHVLLWTLSEHRRLPPTTRDLLEDPDTEAFFSAASIWEIAIKAALGSRRPWVGRISPWSRRRSRRIAQRSPGWD